VLAGVALVAAFAVAWTGVFSGNLWVERNQLNFRYFFPLFAAGLFVITSAATECSVRVVALARGAWSVRGRKRRTARGALPTVQVVLACVALAAAPTTIWLVSRVRVDALVAAEPRVDELADDDIKFVAGDYWRVWPTVVEARAQGLTVWGVTLRSEATASGLRTALAEEVRRNGSAAIMCLDVDAQACLDSTRVWTGLPLTLVSQGSTEPLVIVVQ
jgi:hypothetical protein